MTCSEIVKEIECWASKEIAWQKDNVGLQVGSLSRKVTNILLCLELTNKVLDEALKKNCNFIFSHHPLLFHPMRKIDTHNDKNSLLIEKLIKNDITLYSAHTNLDYTKDGVSFALAKTLKLKNIKFLVNLKSNQYKLTVFVPADNLEDTANAIFNAGGGVIGEYSHCSFRTEGIGTFKGSRKSNPAVGKKETFQKNEEVKLEVIVDSWKLNKVIKDLNKVHPYEEIAYDVIPLDNPNVNYGIGAVGELEKPMSEETFLKYVTKALNADGVRYTKGKKGSVNKVALCGGSGIEYLNSAIAAGADAYITADVKYHSFHDAEGEILLIDAGHYETEIHSLNEVKKRIEDFIKAGSASGTGNKLLTKVFKYSGSTNPINFI